MENTNIDNIPDVTVFAAKEIVNLIKQLHSLVQNLNRAVKLQQEQLDILLAKVKQLEERTKPKLVKKEKQWLKS